jgi:hypothetical protein
MQIAPRTLLARLDSVRDSSTTDLVRPCSLGERHECLSGLDADHRRIVELLPDGLLLVAVGADGLDVPFQVRSSGFHGDDVVQFAGRLGFAPAGGPESWVASEPAHLAGPVVAGKDVVRIDRFVRDVKLLGPRPIRTHRSAGLVAAAVGAVSLFSAAFKMRIFELREAYNTGLLLKRGACSDVRLVRGPFGFNLESPEPFPLDGSFNACLFLCGQPLRCFCGSLLHASCVVSFPAVFTLCRMSPTQIAANDRTGLPACADALKERGMRTIGCNAGASVPIDVEPTICLARFVYEVECSVHSGHYSTTWTQCNVTLVIK